MILTETQRQGEGGARKFRIFRTVFAAAARRCRAAKCSVANDGLDPSWPVSRSQSVDNRKSSPLLSWRNPLEIRHAELQRTGKRVNGTRQMTMLSPLPSREESQCTGLFGRSGRAWSVLLVVAFVFQMACFLRTMRDPWVEEDTWYGAVYAQAAHNNLRAGLAATSGVPVTLYYGPLPIPPGAFYVHHPTLLPLLTTASCAVFGESEWAVRMVPVLCSLLTTLLLAKLVGDGAGRRAGAIAAALFVALPLELHYGDMVDFEPPLLLFMLAAVFCLNRWRDTGRSLWAWLTVGAVALAVWMDWPGYLLTVLMAGTLWREGATASGSGQSSRWTLSGSWSPRPLALGLLTVATLSGIAFLLQVWRANPDGLSDLATAVKMRLGSGVTTGSSALPKTSSVHFTAVEWLQTVGHGLRENYFLLPWLLALLGMVRVWCSMADSPRLRRLGLDALGIAAVGGFYMAVLRNWSYIHDWASFYLIAPVAMLGAVAIDGALLRFDRGRFQAAGVAVAFATVTVLACAGFRQSEAMRSQFLLLNGSAPEPRLLAPKLGKALAAAFPPEAVIVCNFDPYGSALPYYAQRTVLGGLTTVDDWKAALQGENGPVGGAVWLGAPDAAKLLASLPKGMVRETVVEGVRFSLWTPAP